MRKLPLILLTFMAALLMSLVFPQSLRAESDSDRYTIHKKYQTSHNSVHGNGGGHSDKPQHVKNHRYNKDRLGERLAWQEYQGHMQKHYRIMERYGGYSPAAAYVYGRGYGSPRGHYKPIQRGYTSPRTPYRAGH